MTILDDMVSLAAGRLAAWDTSFVLELLPPVEETIPQGETLVVSDYTQTLLRAKKRIISEKAAVCLAGIKDNVFSFSRDYLKLKYPDHRKRRRDTMLLCGQKRPPQVSIPCQIRQGAYVDLKSAWWVLTQAAGWDVDYDPIRHSIKEGTPPSDYPFYRHKMGRSSLVSACISTHVTQFSAGKGWRQVRINNPLMNYSLWGFVMDALHAVATLALDHGAMYVNNDGYIMPVSKAHTFIDALAAWGLPVSIKAQGQAVIWGPGRYAVGTLVSQAVVSKLYRLDNVDRSPRNFSFMASVIPALIKYGTIYL